MTDELCFVLNTLDSYVVWPNGWHTDKTWLRNYFAKAGSFLNAKSYKQFCKQKTYVGRDTNHPFIHENLYKLILLDDVSKGQLYIYPISIKGYNTALGISGIHIPTKVIKDTRLGNCKILFHEVWEGHGVIFNYLDLLKKIKKFYKLPKNSVGFLDGNYLNDSFFDEHEIKGFSVLFFEHNANGTKTFEKAKIHCDDVIQRKVSLPYRFLNLNRLCKYHRSVIAQEMFLNHSSKALWSYTSDDLDTISMHLEKFRHKDNRFINSLPKIIDVDNSVNDNSVNFKLQKQAYLNIITESIFENSSTIFYTEKIFKPIATGQPFILVGSHNSLRKLQELGYRTYSGLINEHYDTIEDPQKRIKEIITEINRLSNMTQDEFENLMSRCYKISKHNVNVMQKRVLENYTYNKLKDNIIQWQKTVD